MKKKILEMMEEFLVPTMVMWLMCWVITLAPFYYLTWRHLFHIYTKWLGE